MRKLKVGDIITYKPWGHQDAIADKVVSIEICQPNTKYGREVTECDLDKHSNVVLDLDSQHWCYKEQLVDIRQT